MSKENINIAELRAKYAGKNMTDIIDAVVTKNLYPNLTVKEFVNIMKLLSKDKI